MASREQMPAVTDTTVTGPEETERAFAGQSDTGEPASHAAETIKPIVVFKNKFIVPDHTIYGLLLTVGNLQTQRILRLRANLSYNPAMYETPLEHEWYAFERTLYAYRLREGALQTPTQEFEQFLYGKFAGQERAQFQHVTQATGDSLPGAWHGLLSEFFRTPAVKIQMVREDLNVSQYQGLSSSSSEHAGEAETSSLRFFSGSSANDSLLLQVTCEEDPVGRPVGELTVGAMVLSHIVDHRDIGQYLAQLLGGRSGEVSVGLTTPVEEIRADATSATLRVRLAPGILGSVTLSTRQRVKVTGRSKPPWWKRWLAWKEKRRMS